MPPFVSEIFEGFLRFWLNPVFYIIVLLSFFLGMRRVKSERRLFHVRVGDVVTDVYHTLVPGLIYGLCLSVFFLGLGLVFPQGVIVLFVTIIFIISLAARPQWLTPVIPITLAAVISFFLPAMDTGNLLINNWLADIRTITYTNYLLLLASLLVVESFLLLFHAKRDPSPRRIQSKRGKQVGGFLINRLWLVPAFIVIPGAGLERLGWWPLFGDAASFSLLLVPFVIGCQQLITYTTPERAVRKEAKRLFIYALVLFPIAIAAALYDWTAVALTAIVVTLIVRMMLYALSKRNNRVRPFYFTEREDGLMILDIIPATPAASMNVKAGEIIRKVNGHDVRTPDQFYRALKANAAFCKLEVLDEHGEVRFEQRALYDDEHHELGLLFVMDNDIANKTNEK